jgi:FkbM family methyltransferase
VAALRAPASPAVGGGGLRLAESESRVRSALIAARTQVSRAPLTGPIYIYGAGNTGKDVAALLRRKDVPIAGFLDANRRTGERVAGLPVWRFDDAELTPELRARGSVVIAVFNRESAISPVVQQLRAFGHGVIETFVDFHARYPGELGDRYWLTDRRCYDAAEDQVLQGLTLWADSASQELYTRILEFRLTGDDEDLPEPVPDQYFAPDVPPVAEPVRFLDGGAYNGDSIATLVSHGLAVREVCAFEPDLTNFAELSRRCQELAGDIVVRLWPAAIGRTTEMLRFAATAGEASRLSPSGATVVPCVALDDILPPGPSAPTFIKLDIEGAEPDALLGAQRLITTTSPRLAVCVYHVADHLWRIPLWVRERWPNYRLYLRNHARHGFDVVMYAVP